MCLSDATFLERFDDLSLDPQHFDHVGHLRLAWLRLRQLPLEAAIESVCAGIQAYATHLGAPDKFHRTVTEALLRIMAQRMPSQGGLDWPQCLPLFEDIAHDAAGVLGQFYSRDLLQSTTARATFVEPNLRPLGTGKREAETGACSV